MDMPKIPVETTPFLWGALAGAIALAIVGFNWGGWVTGSTSENLAARRAEAAVVSTLTPVCVAQFKVAAGAQESLEALKKTDSWAQSDYVSKGGWATMPGNTGEPIREVASACAEALVKLDL